VSGDAILVRHGETDWSRDRRHTGRTDVPLNAAGRAQALLVGDRLGGISFSAVFTSPLTRARETCELAGRLTGAEIVDDLVELDYGAYEGRTTTEIREERPGWDLWRDGCPDGETLVHAGERADRVIARAREQAGDVALFSHGHLLRILAARWIGLEATWGGAFPLETGALCRLGYERERPAILQWNWTPRRIGA
jgi:probable phosphoglycerate mutase